MIFGGIPPLAPPRGRPYGGWGYPKMKIDIIFEIPTIENPKIYISLDFCGIPPLAPQAPPQGRPCGGWGSLK